MRYLEIPFENIFKIWRKIYALSPESREYLNWLDTEVTKRSKKFNPEKIVLFTLDELKKLKEIYDKMGGNYAT